MTANALKSAKLRHNQLKPNIILNNTQLENAMEFKYLA